MKKQSKQSPTLTRAESIAIRAQAEFDREMCDRAMKLAKDAITALERYQRLVARLIADSTVRT